MPGREVRRLINGMLSAGFIGRLRMKENIRTLIFLKSMDDRQFTRTYLHPETGKGVLDRLLALYAWHGRHHVVHTTSLHRQKGW